MSREIARSLVAVAASRALTQSRADAIAAVVLQILKAVARLNDTTRHADDRALIEVRELARLYVTARLGQFARRRGAK